MNAPAERPCQRCGELTRERLGDRPFCRACYEVRSSCCPEFGPDDLTDLPNVTVSTDESPQRHSARVPEG
jgi:hypothetical protein